jgi:hypothetical protein
MFFQRQVTELLFESVNQLQSRMASQIRSQPSWLFTGEVVPVAVGNPEERERDSVMIPNGIPDDPETAFWDEGEHRFRHEAEQF